ncbi:MAG: ABC-F family ATP-binding cassette domain-containing protein [Bacteroidota bacterium]
MITIEKLSQYIGGRTLYENLNLQINPSDKIGLVGYNGSGKSTLFKIMAGESTPSQGKVNRGKETTIGFLNQELLSYQTEQSIKNVAMQAFGHVIKIQQAIDATLLTMEKEYSEELMEKLSHLQEQFTLLNGYDIESKTEQVLESMGFTTEELNRPFSEFSGGWRMRVLFAKLLLQEPSLLLLDEPTNHLDIVSIQWVESYLKRYPHALMVISHDKHFLEATTNKIWEITHERVDVYNGNYAFYEQEKEQRKKTQQNAYVNQQKEIKKTEAFIARFRAKSSKASLVQSRIKSLNKIEKIAPVEDDKVRIKIRFQIQQTSGKEVAHLDHISKAFDELSLIKNSTAHIRRGDKIALIGMNGKGKSTLLKLIVGALPLDNGSITLGHHVTVGFHTQHQLESLKAEDTIYSTLHHALPNPNESSIRAILGAFLFRDDDVYKPIKVLSGGEKARVSLARSLALGPNFLVLDEPTNHLDMVAIDVLCQALQQYEGTLLFVSHNRYLIEKVAKTIWYLEDEKIKEYAGSYREFSNSEASIFG